MSNHISSMQTMQMDEMKASQSNNMAHGNNAGKSSTGSCCSEISQSPLGCALLVPQSAYVDVSGGNERTGYATLLIQSFYIETLAPPPKA